MTKYENLGIPGFYVRLSLNMEGLHIAHAHRALRGTFFKLGLDGSCDIFLETPLSVDSEFI